MAIYRKTEKGTWYFSIYVPGRSRRVRGSCGTASRAEALLIERTMRLAASRKAPKEHVLKIIDALYGEPEHVDIPFVALEAEVSRIATIAGNPPSEGLKRDRRSAVAHLARWAAALCPNLQGVRAIGRAEAQSFAAWLLRLGLSDKSRANLIGALGAMWNVLRREHDGLDNPWPLARPMRVEQRRRAEFSPDEVRRIIAAGDEDGHGWGLAARIAAATGLRYGDIARLRHGDIHDGVIDIAPNKTRGHGIRVQVPLPPGVARLIGNGPDDEPILPEHAAGYASGWSRRHPFSSILAAAGVDAAGRTFHSLRHTFRTQLSRAGVSDEIAMKLGGWTQRATADRYDHDGRAAEKSRAVNAAWDLVNKG